MRKARFFRTLVTLIVLAIVIAIADGTSQPANAATYFDAGEREDLVAQLQEAANQQDVCYSWRLTVRDESGSEGGIDSQLVQPTAQSRQTGSGRETSACRHQLTFLATVVYTADSSESEDYATWSTQGVSTPSSLRVSTSRLVSDPGAEIMSVMPQLPLAAVEMRIAKPVAIEANTEALQADEHLTGSPGSDWVRSNMATLILLAIGFLFGIVMVATAIRNGRRQRSGPREDEPYEYRYSRDSVVVDGVYQADYDGLDRSEGEGSIPRYVPSSDAAPRGATGWDATSNDVYDGDPATGHEAGRETGTEHEIKRPRRDFGDDHVE